MPQKDRDIVAKSTELTVAELLLRYLSIEGTRYIFGVPGAPLAFLLKVLKEGKTGLKYHVCRQETGAGYMADGYARISGKLGVTMVSAGPGATNALTGSAVAQSCGTAVLTISGEVARSAFGHGGFQEGIDATLDIRAIYNSADIYSTVITDPSNFQILIEQALRACLSLPHQAAHVSLPADVGGMKFATDILIPKVPANYRAVPAGRDPAAAKEAMDTLAAAKRPLLYLGNGCRTALLGGQDMTPAERTAVAQRRAAFEDMTTKFALAVTTTPNAKGVFPENHPMSLRNYGFGGSNWSVEYLAQGQKTDSSEPLPYDALVILGSSLTQKSTNNWDRILIPRGPIYHVDLNQSVIGRGFPITNGVVAEAAGFIDDMIEYAGRIKGGPAVAQRAKLIAQLKEGAEAPPPTDPTSAQLVRALNDVLPTGSHLFIDASVCAAAALRYMAIDPPTQMHNAFNMEPMGWAPAAVVGAALAAPDRICVSLSGDGGFMMNGAEISTAAQYGVGAVWVVYCNDTLAAVEIDLQRQFGGDGWMDLYKLGAPNLVQFAAGLGANAVEANIRDFGAAALAAFEAAKLGKPQVIVVRA
ncbi:MAG: thiamine pyrophosphate-binding protein [Alphaproteobacteria bacterium]|nr:thiamine pyrophosphate-binding protein [Alphaproteobacteria bacterium]